jgi:homospermidine synthase
MSLRERESESESKSESGSERKRKRKIKRKKEREKKSAAIIFLNPPGQNEKIRKLKLKERYSMYLSLFYTPKGL